MLFNEAGTLGAQAEPAGEERGHSNDSDQIDVPGHKRAQRGRKPLDPARPHELIRHDQRCERRFDRPRQRNNRAHLSPSGTSTECPCSRKHLSTACASVDLLAPL
ncbi:MAG: hypothetical protein ACT6S0_01100 [Roseateles sp.]